MAPKIPGPKPGGDINLLELLGGNLFNLMVMRPLSHLLAWVLDGEPEDWDTLEELRDNLIPALIRLPLRILVELIGDIPIIGNAVENALAGWLKTTNSNAVDAKETVIDIETRVTKIQEIFDVTSTRSLADGLDPTGESTFRYEQLQRQSTNPGTSGDGGGFPAHTHPIPVLNVGLPFIPVTSGMTLLGWIRLAGSTPKAQATWIAYKTGTVTDFRIGIKFMASNGVVSHYAFSPSMHNDLVATNSGAWMQFAFPPFTPEQGDIVGFEFSMIGSGTVNIAGINLLAPLALPGFRPAQIGAIKPSGGLGITYTDAEMLSWASGFTPYVQIGSDVGQIGNKRSFVDNFNRTTGMGPNWILRMLADKTVNLSIQGTSPARYVDNTAHQLFETWADGQWVQPLATDDVGTQALMWGTNTTAPSVLIINGNGGFSSWVQFAVWADKVRIYTCVSRDADGWTSRAEVPIGCDQSVWTTMKFTYDSATRTYRGFKNGTQIISWVDSGNIMPTGPGFRYTGIAIDHFNFNTGPFIDNWAAWDV